MAETPRELIYPESDAHTRLWEHFQSLADSADDAITAAIAAAAPVDSGGVTVPYATGYKASGQSLRVRKIGKVCHLTGTVTATSNSLPVATGGVDVATLPAGFLPDSGARELVSVPPQNPSVGTARAYITTSGMLRVYTYSSATAYVDVVMTYFTD
jgi:hypothetical protein